MANFFGPEQDSKQLQTNVPSSSNCLIQMPILGMNEDGYLTWCDRKPSYPLTESLLWSHNEFSDEYSVIGNRHINAVDTAKPVNTPFRWNVNDVNRVTIFNMSSKFGPMRFIDLDVVPEMEGIYDFKINEVYMLEPTDNGCIEPVCREHDAEGQTIRLFQGTLFTNCHLEAMATSFGSKWGWEDTPELKLYPLIQYWAFHHQEAVHLLQRKEMYDA